MPSFSLIITNTPLSAVMRWDSADHQVSELLRASVRGLLGIWAIKSMAPLLGPHHHGNYPSCHPISTYLP